MKTASIIISSLFLSACALTPNLYETQLKGKATSQISGDFSYSIEGRKKPNAILCMVGLELPSKGHWNNIDLVYYAEHYSLCNSNRDRGEERIGVGLTWRPFK